MLLSPIDMNYLSWEDQVPKPTYDELGYFGAIKL